jgi:excinuclease UvrABC nuclease subunit
MPFQYGPYTFDKVRINSMVNSFGVYGLARGLILGQKPAYVGKSKFLRDRLSHWLNNPPGPGLTHFYAEAFATEALMNAREEQLIKEFQPTLNTLLK